MAPGRPEDDDSDEDDNQNSDDSEDGGFRLGGVGSRSAKSSSAGDDSEGAMGKLKWLEQWEPWRNFVIIVILLNTIVLAMEADNPNMTWSPVVDSIFLGIFCFELVLRLVVYRCDFFVNEDRGWNWFDFIVVGLGVMDQCVFDLFWDNDEGNSQVSNIIAAMRVIRLLRVLRAVRIFKQLKPLRLLANGLINSLSSVFWIALMFLSLVFTSAILVTTVIGNSDQHFKNDEQIQRWFGTMGKSMETLSIFLTCDDWSTPARMVNEVYPYMEFFWIWYIVMGAFWVLSLLTGLMADKMKEARDEDEDEQKTEPHEFEELLESLRSKQEREGPLSIDCKAFQEIVSQEKVSKALGDAGLKDMDDNHLSWLFKAFDRDNNGTISWDELKESLTQISRHASPLASPLEIMKIEGVLVRLDRTLRNWRTKHPSSADKHHRNDMGWDQRLELVHARSALLKERLKALDGDLQVFFKAMNYDPKADAPFKGPPRRRDAFGANALSRRALAGWLAAVAADRAGRGAACLILQHS
eukprot:CAMPEP_0177488520 /NCGR_PEP_ID=MMETSP0369-20130122/30200_1 /TAXON_ID=447022 ORGANISM="Scrippsiella hangoei-like, Strain SHHI-4" /NCGR_SAMPLE_ID=MMETSP0369 /ASSEMBLY_ACC=CAM_ASM_000364 /LENGTH=524 /DNA_ID=CAMNT_0018964895 /DNA_START=8 /DNA_END=1579 /DNA_ORIENTATION=-